MNAAPVHIAAVQAAPFFFDNTRTLAKACELIAQAGARGARLAAFGESWLPGYPFFVDSEPDGAYWDAAAAYRANAIAIPGPETEALCGAARKAGCDVVIGVTEKGGVNGNSLYCTLLFISAQGQILGRHRKIKATHNERALWADGDVAGLTPHARAYGRLSGLNCWEHNILLPAFALAAQGVDIHVAAWPGREPKTAPREPVWARQHLLSRAFASQVGAYVVCAAGLRRRADVDPAYAPADLFEHNGQSCIIDPFGEIVAGPMDGEGILLAAVEPRKLHEAKIACDPAGHYSRPDLFSVQVAGRTLFGLAQDKPAPAQEEAGSDQRFKNLYDHAAIGIYRSTRDGRALYANPAFVRMMGYQSEEEWVAAIGSIEQEWYVDPQRRDQFLREIKQEGRVTNFVSEVYRHRTKEKIWVSETARVIFDENGAEAYFEGTIEDISDQKAAEQRLREAIEIERRAGAARDLFFANVTHELRTPLNAIIGYSDLVEEDLAEGRTEGIAADVARVRQAAQHQLALINDILDHAKIAAGKLEINSEDVSLLGLIDACVEMVAPASTKNNVRLLWNGAAPVDQIRTDPTRLRQILLNLLSNACKFSKDGEVTVHAERQDDAVVITVADTGIGMSAEQVEKLFRPFAQAEKTTAAAFGGTGLGLALSQSLAQLLGGAITVKSERGKGSRFSVHIPIAGKD